ncbi:MAG: glycosyltransferase [Planctomycetes bacterium]|nr:glycosyltransferase [Planctomycetota bacterium]
MQTHRLFPELIAGFAEVALADARLHLVVLGRGTHREQVAFEPARRSGVGERIHFPGYLDTEAYPRALPAFDALIYLVPGSDGTCRAAREALASGVPLISTHRGLLATINEKGRTGVFIEAETPSGIAAAIRSIVEDTPLRERLASGARSRARERFDAQRHARELVAVYRESIA